MNADSLAHYRKLLEEQLASLRKTAGDHLQQIDESRQTNDFTGGDRAAELESMEVDTTISAREEQLARKVGHALERIEAGDYGHCEECGDEIPAARLEAKPSVSLCIDCQEKHEAEAG